MQLKSNIIASSTLYQSIFDANAGGIRFVTLLNPGAAVALRQKDNTNNEIVLSASVSAFPLGVCDTQNLEVRGNTATGFTIYSIATELHPNI